MSQPQCPKCEARMEPGFALDRGESTAYSMGTWVDGPPLPLPSLRGMFTNHLKGRKQWGITGRRCVGCGFVEMFAKEI
jgi:hypothetical protein